MHKPPAAVASVTARTVILLIASLIAATTLFTNVGSAKPTGRPSMANAYADPFLPLSRPGWRGWTIAP